MLIAEDSTAFPKITAPVEYDGLGFDYKWDLGWMNDTLDYFRIAPVGTSQSLSQADFLYGILFTTSFLFSHSLMMKQYTEKQP